MNKLICKLFHKNNIAVIFKKETTIRDWKAKGKECIEKKICNKCGRIIKKNEV